MQPTKSLMFISSSSSSSSSRAASTDLPGPLSPPVSIVHCSREAFKAISCVSTEMLYIGSSWSSCLCEGVYRSISLTSSSFPCPDVRLTLIVFVMGGRWPYSCCFVECCLWDLFNIACSILALLPSIFFSIRLVSVQVVHPYSSVDTTADWKKLHFILSVRSDFHMTDSLSIAAHAFASRVLISFSVAETLFPR